MRRFLVVLSLIIFTTSSAFAACSAGYQEVTVTGSHGCYIGKGWDGNSGSSGFGISCDSNDLTGGQWKVAYRVYDSDGYSSTRTDTVYGIASCNYTWGSTGSSKPADTFTNSASGFYCWCKRTHIKRKSGETIEVPSLWIFDEEFDSSADCKESCSYACAGTTVYQSQYYGSMCSACPAKPEGATWTSGCNYKCAAGTYTSTTTSSTTTTVPITWPTTEGTGSTYNGSAKTWSVTWSNDTASGSSSCSSSSSSYNTSTGKYCWCKLTSWNSSSLNASWVHCRTFSGSGGCNGTGTSGCAYACSYCMKTNSSRRSQMFATVTNVPTTEVTTTTTTTSCESCPSGGTSNAGATAITQCYVPTTTNFTDAAGTYTFSSNCYYSN